MDIYDEEDSPQTDDEAAEIEMGEEEIDENLEESFPASDPPSWTLGSNHRPARREDDEPQND